MKNIKTGTTEKETYSKCSLDGITVPVKVYRAIDNSAFSGQIIDTTKMRIKATIKGRGADVVMIPNLQLRSLLECGTIELRDFDFWFENDKLLVLAHGASNKAIAEILLHVPFGSVVNIKGNEWLEVEYTVDDGFFTSQCDQTLSFVQADISEAIGVELYTPIFDSVVIDQDQDEQTIELGDNVTRIVISQRDKTSLLAADQVITKLDLTCDKFKRRDTDMELYGRQLMFYPTVAEAQSRYQNYLIHDGVELDKVSILLTLNSGNVNASKNYVVWRSFKSSKSLIERGNAMLVSHKRKDLSKFGIAA